MSIPKRIFSIWLGNKHPRWIQNCLDTHKQLGFEHRLITLDIHKVIGRSAIYNECRTLGHRLDLPSLRDVEEICWFRDGAFIGSRREGMDDHSRLRCSRCISV